MASENENNPAGARRQRPPAVIDLPATEVPPQAQSASGEAAAAPPEPPKGEPPPPMDRRPSFGPVGGAFAGATGGLLVALLFWWFGAFVDRHQVPADPDPRLAALEKQLKDLAARPVAASVDPGKIGEDISREISKEIGKTNKAVDEVTARLARLESAQAMPRAAVTDPVVLGRLNAVESATKSVADNVAALSRRAEGIDAALRDTNNGIAKLSAALAEVRSTASAAAAGSDRASRFAIAATVLRTAVEHGDPFTAELAIVKPLASDADAIAALEPFAAAGVPANAPLGQELAGLIRPTLHTGDAPPAKDGFLHRLKASAEKLIRIRPTAGMEPRGDDGGAILARAAQRGTEGNVAGAMAELAKLPAAARAPFQAWIARAEARNKALDASWRLAAAAVAALKVEP